MFKRLLFAVVALIAASGGYLSYQAGGFGKTTAGPEPSPKFELPDLDGTPRSSDEWNGKVRVINFWATWCPPCLEEIPVFMEVQEKYRAQGLQFIGIALEEAEDVRTFHAKHRINYPILVAGLGGLGLSNAYGNRAGVVPFSVVVNREGRIVHTQPGIFEMKKLLETVTPLL